jgi:adenylate cyclase
LSIKRRLSAVLALDMVGYSRLMAANEQNTLATFRRHRRDILNPKAAQYHGRIVKLTGDGALMEFASVVDAISFAVEVQLAIGFENAELPEARRILYRIGINIGDIVIDDGDIYGDGVNVATRLEQLAEPGGIYLSGHTCEQARGKLDLSFEPVGERRLKNIAEPLSVHRVKLDEKALLLVTPIVARKPEARLPRRVLAAAIAGALLLVLCAGAAVWLLQPWAHAPPSPPAAERFAHPLPDKPSIAVLPFVNVSGDADRDRLAEGLTDDLITDLSKVSDLFVIARHSVFALGDTAGKVQEVAAELGVNFVLQGMLQKDGARLKVGVKLVDALRGLSVWTQRYDRDYADIFDVRDDIVSNIISTLSVTLNEKERNQLAQIPTDNLEAYDYYLRAEHEGFLYSDVESYRQSLSFYQKAIELDPRFADAYAGIARVAIDVLRNDYNLIWSAAIARKIAYDAAGQALALNPDNARARTVLALLQLVDGRAAEAIDSANRAVVIQPNDSEAVANLALVLVQTGSRDEALIAIEKALRLNPSPPPNFQLLAGVVFYLARDNDRAIPLLRTAAERLPDVEPAREYLAAAYAVRGDQPNGKQQAAALLKLFPETNLTYYGYLYDYWDEDDRRYHLKALRAVGIPEWPFAFQGEKKDRLGHADLEDLISGKTWTGRHKNGATFVQYFDASGNTAYRSANTNITGTAEIQDDHLCEKFDGYFMDRLTCGYVYRLAGRQDGVQYVHVTPQALKYFSVEKDR